MTLSPYWYDPSEARTTDTVVNVPVSDVVTYEFGLNGKSAITVVPVTDATCMTERSSQSPVGVVIPDTSIHELTAGKVPITPVNVAMYAVVLVDVGKAADVKWLELAARLNPAIVEVAPTAAPSHIRLGSTE